MGSGTTEAWTNRIMRKHSERGIVELSVIVSLLVMGLYGILTAISPNPESLLKPWCMLAPDSAVISTLRSPPDEREETPEKETSVLFP